MKKLIQKYLTREIIAYVIVGALTTLVNYIFYYGLLWLLETDYRIANAVAWLASVIFAYFANRRYVFESDRSGKANLPEFLKFTGSRVLTFLFEEGSLILTVELLHLSETWMKLAVSVVVVILNYIFSKLILKKKETPDE